MKKIVILASALAILAPSAVFAQSGQYYDRSYVRMSYVQGDVYVQRTGDLGYEQGEVNLVVIAGDRIGTRAGRLELQLGLGNYVRLDNDSVVEVAALPGADGEPTKIHVLAGSVFVRLSSLDGARNFEVHSPDASFYLLSEGLYRFDVRGNGETELSVFEGEAEASGEQGSIVARSGESLVASNGRFVANAARSSVDGDDFRSWNDSRDALLAPRAESSYLPAGYSDYDYELASNGRWTYEPDYGYVWVPRVLYTGWRPYEYGRWVWYPVIGWTWVSYEPWGWCTSHYGRWGWRLGLGWYWIPRSHWHWGPAWVHWWWDRDYIGWCPLSYYGYPAVFVNNRFHDRYLGRDFPRDGRSLMMVRRGQLQDRNLRGAVLDGNTLARVGRDSMRNGQPDLRPNLVRSGDLASRARGVIAGSEVRGVSRNFRTGSSRPAPDTLRQSVIRKSTASSINGERTATSLGSAASGSRIIRQSDAETSGNPQRLQPQRRTLDPGTGRPSADAGERQIRSFPSRESPSSGTFRTVNPETRSTDRTSDIRRSQTARTEGGTIRENPSRSAGSQALRPNAAERNIQERPSRSTSPTVRTPADSRGSSVSTSRVSRAPSNAQSSPSRTLRSPSGAASYPSRTPSSTSRSSTPSSTSSRILRTPSGSGSGGASSRSLSLPSRSSASPSRSAAARSSSALSRSLSAPSRSSAAPSRSLVSPSRSGSSSRSAAAPSRSLSAPSRSSGSSSRSVSSPSRSSTSRSRSSGTASRSAGRSSSSGGRIRK